MKTIKFIFILCLTLVSNLFGNTSFRVMTYNALNFDGYSRLSNFQTVLETSEPDILITQEIKSENAADSLLTILNNTNRTEYARANFVYDGELNNMLFYRTSIAMLISQNVIDTSPRDISEYVISISGNPVRFYSCHLKASQGYEDERLAAIAILRDSLNNLEAGTEFIIVGDMNFYTSSEPAYQKLIEDESNNIGRAQDLSDQVGNWHENSSFAEIHTQSTRKTGFDYGASGGLDDRFDFIFSNYGLNDGAGIEFVGNYTPYGNDGNHFNQSVNYGTNSAVPDSVADALYYASDHLPVYADFESISGTQSYLFISEYIEGYGDNKALEIYNGTGSSVDLSYYKIWRITNGGTWLVNDGNDAEITLNGILSNGDVYVIANPSADTTILNVADYTTGNAIWNGDDAVGLVRSGTLIDAVGEEGPDPGTGWNVAGITNATKNHTLVRKSTVPQGNTDWSASAGTDATNSEWIVYPQDTFTYLGYHEMINPTITVTTPNSGESWERGNIYNITWTSNDFDGNIKIELLRDGVKDTTELVASTENDSLWQWTIPSDQTIADDYKIKISDSDDGIPCDESNAFFSITGIYTIAEIQYTTATSGNSPFAGDTITISGIVTASKNNNCYFLQDDVGAWNGIFVYDNTHNPNRGDSLTISGLVSEYYNKTELKDIANYTVNSTGNELPEVVTITTGEVSQEMYEGILVNVTDAECTNDSLDYGEWLVNDGSGSIRIDDLMYSFSPTVGTLYNITGVVDYTFYNFKIEPRDANDIQLPAPENVTISVYSDSVHIQWDAVTGANSYEVYSSDYPYESGDWFNETPAGITETNWSEAVSGVKKFYYVKALN